MPRFPVTFGKRRSTADNFENVSVAEHSFRVLDRSEVAGKSIDGGTRLGLRSQTMPRMPTSDTASFDEDNIFADVKTNRCVYPYYSPKCYPVLHCQTTVSPQQPCLTVHKHC